MNDLIQEQWKLGGKIYYLENYTPEHLQESYADILQELKTKYETLRLEIIKQHKNKGRYI